MDARELDAQVATALGWRVRVTVKVSFPFGEEPTEIAGPREYLGLPPGNGFTVRIPFFSRQIDLAWRLVEQMRQLGWEVEVSGYPIRYRVLATKLEPPSGPPMTARPTASGEGGEAAEAICYAFLEVARVEAESGHKLKEQTG